MILEAAYAAHTSVGSLAFWLGCAAAFLTAFYSWRLLIMAFHGKPRASAEVMSHVHESPLVMTLPLLLLSFGAVFSGWLGYELFVGAGMDRFWGDSILILPIHPAMENAHHVPTWVKLLPIGLATSGVILAVLCYSVWTGLPAATVRAFRPVHTFFFNKWYFDELYDAIFVRPAVRIGTFLWERGDRDTIDGLGPDGLSGLVVRVSAAASRLQSGFVFHYAFAMLIGVVALVTWYYLRFGGM
jgi:NADH-quinone oxidoreductase subunit L